MREKSFPDYVANLSLEALDKWIDSLLDSIVGNLLAGDKSRFINAHYITVNGTKDPVISFEFNATRFNSEMRAALRTRGIELSKRD